MLGELYRLWSGRNPQWEIRYEENIIRRFCDYGVGANNNTDNRARILGAGYEIFIIAFFIGLYSNRKRALFQDNNQRSSFGYPIINWGNSDRGGRRSYPKLREYIFIALISRTDIDFIALEKGEITPYRAVDMLIQTMEEYANYGFAFIEDKLVYNPNYFYNERAFLEIFLSFGAPNANVAEDDEPEPLD